MRSLHKIAIDHPRATIGIAIAVTLAVAPGVVRLKLRTDGHALVPADAPAVIADAQTRQDFGLDDPVVVVIRSNHPDGIFNADTVRLVDDLTKSFQKLEGVRPSRVFSLGTEVSDRVWSGSLNFRRLLEPVPQTPKDLAQLRTDLRQIQLYNGTFASDDYKSTAIMVGVPSGEDRLGLLKAIQGVVEGLGPIPEHIDIIGAPVAEALLGTHILEDLGVPAELLGFRTFDEAGSPAPSGSAEREAISLGAFLRLWIARKIGLVPVAILVMAVVFLVCFRSFAAMVLPLGEVAAALVFVFALMGWLGVPIYLTTAVLPIVLTATGITDEIHVFSRYRQLLQQNPERDHVDIVRETMGELARPIIMTSVTTGIAFLSFAFSSIGPVRAFGIFTGIGSIFCMLWSITVIPACFVLLSPRHFARARSRLGGSQGAMFRVFASLGRSVVRFRAAVLLLALACVAATPYGIRCVVVQDSWIDGFAEGSKFRGAMQFFNDHFHGMHVLEVAVDGGEERVVRGSLAAENIEAQSIRVPVRPPDWPDSVAGWRIQLDRTSPSREPSPPTPFPTRLFTTWIAWVESDEALDGGVQIRIQLGHPSPVHVMRLQPAETVRYTLSPATFMRPDVLKRVGDFEDFLAGNKSEAVGGVLGPTDYVSTVSYMIHGRKAKDRRVPPDVRQVERMWREYGNIRGKERLSQLVDPTYTRAIITVLLKNANFVDTARLMQAIRDYEAKNLVPQGIKLSFAGDVAVSQTLIEEIVRTEVQSLAGTMLGVLLVTVVLGRSLAFGLLCVIPSTIAVLANFAVMGWSGMPLGVATSMFSAMTIGIGVDYAIHLQSRFRRLRSASNAADSHQAAVVTAVAATGAAIAVDTLAVALGFGILVFSQVPANARLGALVALSIINCFLVTVFVLPAVLSFARPARHSIG